MPHKKVLHFLLIALLLLYGLGLVGLGYLIVGALLNLLAFHLLRVLFAGLLEDRALELQLLVGLSLLCQSCYVLISLIDILWFGLAIFLGCHFGLILLSLHHNELKCRQSLADQHHMEAHQSKQHKGKRQCNSKQDPSNHHYR